MTPLLRREFHFPSLLHKNPFSGSSVSKRGNPNFDVNISDVGSRTWAEEEIESGRRDIILKAARSKIRLSLQNNPDRKGGKGTSRERNRACDHCCVDEQQWGNSLIIYKTRYFHHLPFSLLSRFYHTYSLLDFYNDLLQLIN